MITNKLQDMREDKEMTQNDLANILKITQQNYSRWEVNEKIIPIKHLNNLSNYFNCSLDYLMNLNDVFNYPNNKKEINKIKVGERLKEFRINANLTQRQLAEILNTTHSTISAYETGKTLLLLAFAYDIATKYHISLDWLYGRIDEPKKIK